MDDAFFVESNYPCINYKQIDLSRGCNVNCIYCGLANNNSPTNRFDISNLLNSSEIPEGLYFSPNSDPFSKINIESTHSLLQKYLPLGVKVLIITKKIIPQKTIELIAKYSNQVIPKISLARLDEELSGYIESGADSPDKRLQTLKQLTDAGLKAQLLLMPLFPGVDDSVEKIENIINRASDYGVKYVKASYAILRDSGKPKDQVILDKVKNHPVLIKSWNLMTEEIKLQIGSGKTLPLKQRINFYKMINSFCIKNDIVFSACTVLDPALKNHHELNFAVCDNIYSIYNKK